jgi:hypothetical protein
MTLQSNAFTSYSTIGLKEDLSDTIFNVNKGETNFLSRIQRTKATQKFHEWQTDDLPSVSTSNAQLEGDAWALAATSATTRLGNYCQIAYKCFGVTASQEAMDKAGRQKEIAYQTLKFGKALKRDIEAMLLDNNARVAGNATTAREFGSVLSYLATNDSFGATGASPVGANGSAARTDGTQRAFTEAQLAAVLQTMWETTGSMERCEIFIGGFNKRVFSGFTGVATKTKDADDKKIMATADIYVSDFGTMYAQPNRLMRTRDALVLNMDYWALAELRPVRTMTVLDGIFDGEARTILWEGTLEARNEAASGGVFDLTTS